MAVYVAQCSGGKDSVATVLLCLEQGRPLDAVTFCDTGLEFPAIYKTIEDVKKLCESRGVEFYTLRDEHGFMWYFCEKELTRGKNKGEHGYGFPSMRQRWCTKHLKVYPHQKFVKEHWGGQEVFTYIGIAADEIERVKDDPHLVYPLVEAGMTEADAMAYCKRRGFTFYGHYGIMRRSACWCCPLQNVNDLRALYDNYPDLWRQLIEMEKKKPARLAWNFRGKKTAADYQRRFEIEDKINSERSN